MIGFFTIPVGTIIFIFFVVEYKKGDEKEIAKENWDDALDKEKKEETNNEENLNQDENVIIDENNRDSNNKDNQNEKDNDNNNDKENEESLLEKELKTMSKNKKIKKVIKTFRFWRLALVQLFLTFSFSFILGTGRTFGALIGIDGKALQFLMLCQTGALILIGPLLGIIADKKGPLNLLRIQF